MWARILQLIIKSGILVFVLVAVGLVALGNVINALINWDWLVYFFKIFLSLINLIWFLPIPTIITLVSYSFTILIAYWTFKAVILASDWFIK